MGATITDGTTTITPLLVLGYQTNQTGRNVLHDILGRADFDVSLRTAGLRSGTLNLLFGTEADAQAARVFHAAAARFTYTDTDVPSAGMVYVLDAAQMTLELDPDTQRKWTLAVPYQEVLW